MTYGMGMIVAADCDLGLTLSHSGGYPGYGSHVLLLPEHGIGVFVFANRTYAFPAAPAWDAAMALHAAGWLKGRATPLGDPLAGAYRAAGAAYERGDVAGLGGLLAMNFLLDRSAESWARELARLKRLAGACETAAPITPTGALAGEFTWTCAHGRLKGSLLLAPTHPPTIQAWRIGPAAP
jgi:hypothetical protein